jgi:hypothetical protein
VNDKKRALFKDIKRWVEIFVTNLLFVLFEMTQAKKITEMFLT